MGPLYAVFFIPMRALFVQCDVMVNKSVCWICKSVFLINLMGAGNGGF